MCSIAVRYRSPVAWLPLAAVVVSAWAFAATAAPTVLDFEDIAPGTTISAEYGSRGVIFDRAYLSNAALFNAGTVAHSGTRVLRSDNPINEFHSPPLVITFTSPQARVKFFAGTEVVAIIGTLQAKDANGTVVATDGPRSITPNEFTTAFEVVAQTASIVRVEFQLEGTAFEAIDDLEFEGEPPAPPPTEPPIVQVTLPANGSDLDISTLDITGTARGEGLLSVVTIRIEWLRPPEQSTAPVFTSTVALTGTGTTRQFSLLGFTGVPYGPITVTAEAENTGGKKGTGSSTFTNLPAAIRSRFIAEGGTAGVGAFRFGGPGACPLAVYDRAAISLSGTGTTYVIRGSILTKWLSLRTLADPQGLGCPLGEEHAGPAASRMQDFEKGRIYTNLSTGTVYVPTVFVDVIDKQEVEFPDAGATVVPLIDPVSAPDQGSQTWLFQQFIRPSRLDLQPATLEIRGTPPTLWVERQFGTHEAQTAAIWDSFPCEGNLGPCSVPPPQTVFPPIQNAGDLYCGGEALRGGGNEAEIVAQCVGSDFTNCARREWAPIKGDEFVGTPIFGYVGRSALAGEDFRFSHEWYYNCPGETVRIDCPSDWTLDIFPIGPHRDVAPHQSLFAAGNPTKVELEYEYFYGSFVSFLFGDQPAEGDLIYAVGRWIIDCGHDNFRSELHPIYMYSKMRIVDEIINHFTKLPEENPFGGRVATRADIWVNGWYPGGQTIEFDVYPPPRPNPNCSLIVKKPVDQDALSGLDFEWSMEPAGAANHVHIKFNAPFRANHVTDWGEVKYMHDRGYEGQWYVYWSQ